MEVFDSDDREFGLEAVKHVLIQTADRSLADVLSALPHAVQAHGVQIDDQSALVLRDSVNTVTSSTVLSIERAPVRLYVGVRRA